MNIINNQTKLSYAQLYLVVIPHDKNNINKIILYNKIDLPHSIDDPIKTLFHITKTYKKCFLLNIPGFMITENKSDIDKIILENVLDFKVDVSE